jgi:hypothetical protein
MNQKYFLILPNVFIHEPCVIGELILQRFGSENDAQTVNENTELLLNIQQMLFNNGFSGAFTYSYLTTCDEFENVVLSVRKIMTLCRYIIFEEHNNLSLESLSYYLLRPTKISEEKPKMKYSLEGIQNGNQYAHFWAPGFREITKRVNYPEFLQIPNDHYLIKKFNTGKLEEKYIIAIERFNRTLKENYDPVEDILNLTTAFEHIFELKGSDKAESLGKNLVHAFKFNGSSLESFFTEWSKEFYKVRGEVSHGNAFKHYAQKNGYSYWEECFKWKHPDGTTRYVNHTSIAKKVFTLLIERLLKGTTFVRDEIEDASGEMKKFLNQLETKLVESQIEPLITPNEIYYNKLKELIDSNLPFGRPYYDPISKIKQNDRTGTKPVLLDILKYFLNITKERFRNLKVECDEIENLILEEKPIASIALRTLQLSQKIDELEAHKKLFDDERIASSYLAKLFEKVHRSLMDIAWFEKAKS